MSDEKVLAIQLLGNEKAGMVEVKIPTISPGEVLVKISSLVLCGSDINLNYRPSVEQSKKTIDAELGIDFNPKAILSCKINGIIIDSNNYDHLNNGDKVIIFPLILNINSVFYEDRLSKYATPLQTIGYTLDGGNTEYLSVPDNICYALPDYITFDQGAMLLDPVGVPFGVLKKLNADYSDIVLILGCDPIVLGATVICFS